MAAVIGLQGMDIPVAQLPANFFIALVKVVATRFGGAWQSTDSAGRFRVDIDGPRVVCTENGTNGQHVVTVQTAGESSSDEIRMERANDDAVLQFLGFASATLRAEKLAAGPGMSFLQPRRSGSQLDADWHGLLVGKRADG